MSILIKGMTMPVFEHASWDIRKGTDGKWYMVDTNAETTDGEWHEIIPVPPHGRLIDADALIDYCKPFAEVFKGSSLSTDKARRDELLCVIGEITNALTVIEAEEDET